MLSSMLSSMLSYLSNGVRELWLFKLTRFFPCVNLSYYYLCNNRSLLCLCLPVYSLVWTIYYRLIICLPVYSLVWITYYYVLFGMYKVISLSVSCRRDIFGLNCSESTASFSFCIICEVSHESSQMTVQNGPCLFACALSLRCVWDLRLEFHFSNCPFIHLCESQFIIAC